MPLESQTLHKRGRKRKSVELQKVVDLPAVGGKVIGGAF
jgi:hypothetical protein